MKLFFLPLLMLASVCAADVQILPQPHSLKLSKGAPYTLSGDSSIFYETRSGQARDIEESLAPMARVLAGEIELITGVYPKAIEYTKGRSPKNGDIVLQFLPLSSGPAETEVDEDQSYELSVRQRGIIVRSSSTKGVSYGTASLIQAFQKNGSAWEVPALEIKDAPVSDFRTVMLDVARKIHSPGVIRDVVRLCRLYKIRYLHLHITDDQHFTFPFEPITKNLKKNFSYTREELEDLVRYADARGVTLIPELDLPGHSSRLRESGYLDPGKNDADVASPKNSEKIHTLIDSILDVFVNSPYFHIGGDESSAGSALVPFLEATNKHVRSRNRRLLVWEGFHGAPTSQLPAKGDDRIIVVAWESSYNSPWNLLESGYEIVNASWKPMYVVGGFGDLMHPGSSGGRKFDIEDIYRWSPQRFMHWEPGRPVYEDRGPKDPDLGDSEWDASWIGKEDQVIGGQLLFWEQPEMSVLKFFRTRVPTTAERLWNRETGEDFATFEKRLARVDERVMTIVQPVEVLPSKFRTTQPIEDLYHPYEGEELTVTMRNRTQVNGTIRFTEGSMANNLGGLRFSKAAPPTGSSKAYEKPFQKEGGGAFRAQLFRDDGTPVEGHTWQFYNNWIPRVKVTEFDNGKKTVQQVPDMAALSKDKIVRTYTMPMLRGLIRNIDIRAQMSESVFTAPGTGEFTIGMKTQSGHATLHIDLDQDGKWASDEAIIRDTPSDESHQTTIVSLRKGERYNFRVDHNTGMPRPVLSVSIEGPGVDRKRSIDSYLTLPQ